MTKSVKADTKGEQLFLDYLARFNIPVERWAKKGGKQPDWLVKTPVQEIVAENKDIDWGKADDAMLRVLQEHGGAYVGAFPAVKTQNKLIEALDKLSAVPEDMAYMPVIFNDAGHPYTNDVVFVHAIYGPTQLSTLVNAEGAQSESRYEPRESMTEEHDERFGFFGKLGLSRRVSAVAAVWNQNDRHSMFVNYVIAYAISENRRTDLSAKDLNAWLEDEFAKVYTSLPKLCVYHNPFATLPIRGDAFAFDQSCRQVWWDKEHRTFLIYGEAPPTH